MNIAIVDDDIHELQAAEYYLREFIKKNYPELFPNIKIQTFSGSNDFLNAFKPGLFQLVILDIMMGEINGLQTAQIIRARGDDDVNIVFLTNNDNFILNGYRVFAVGYFLSRFRITKKILPILLITFSRKSARKPPKLS